MYFFYSNISKNIDYCSDCCNKNISLTYGCVLIDKPDKRNVNYKSWSDVLYNIICDNCKKKFVHIYPPPPSTLLPLSTPPLSTPTLPFTLYPPSVVTRMVNSSSGKLKPRNNNYATTLMVNSSSGFIYDDDDDDNTSVTYMMNSSSGF